VEADPTAKDIEQARPQDTEKMNPLIILDLMMFGSAQKTIQDLNGGDEANRLLR
jgi:hypothetical protein